MDATLLPRKFAPCTPSDTTRLDPECIGLFVGGAGNVIVQGDDNQSATFVCTAGQLLPGRFRRVMAATSATAIVVLKEK